MHTYRAFSRDVTAAILVFQNKETAAILVYQTSPLGVKPYFDEKQNRLLFANMAAFHVRENAPLTNKYISAAKNNFNNNLLKLFEHCLNLYQF